MQSLRDDLRAEDSHQSTGFESIDVTVTERDTAFGAPEPRRAQPCPVFDVNLRLASHPEKYGILSGTLETLLSRRRNQFNFYPGKLVPCVLMERVDDMNENTGNIPPNGSPQNEELPLLLGTHSGSVLGVTTVTTSPGVGCPGLPPTQASFLWTCAHLSLVHIDCSPVAVAAALAVVFTLTVYTSPFITAASLRDLISSTLSIFNDEFSIIDQREGLYRRSKYRPTSSIAKTDSFVVRLAKKLLLGLPSWALFPRFR